MAAALRLTGGLLAAALLAVASPAVLPESAAETVLTVDVAVVGAGASGGYAAIRLKEDYDQNIVVIEKQSKLGGHVSTFHDEETGTNFNFGVQSFNDIGPARDFFTRLGVEIGAAPRVPLTQRFVDFSTGEEVGYVPSSAADRTAALQAFLAATEDFEQYILPGYWNFPEPVDIPEDLLLPFGQFVEKYSIQACVNQVFEVTGMGVGDFENALTMYVLSAFGPPMIRAFLGQGTTFVPTSGRNIEVYEKIQARLGESLLLGSTVVQSTRSDEGHVLWVKGSDGKITLVRAAKLLLAIEPTTKNMAPFSLDTTEKTVFNKFRWSNVHAGIVSHSSLPKSVSLVNIPEAGAPTNYMELPKPNFNARFDWMGGESDNWRVLMVGDEHFTKCKAQSLVKKNFEDMVKADTLEPKAEGSGKLKIKAWADHGAMHMHASAEDIRAGFIQELYGLQGHRNTWWTGGAFAHQFQSVLWQFDDILLPKLLGLE
ncbi:hypothetical protein OQA88_13467 [Cercophora sp. LCS_1]